MSLEYAILGALNYHPSSGYDLKKIFDSSVQHFWSADQSQIYRTLGRLTEQSYVEMNKIEQDDRPDRKVYSITDSGREELHRWLAGPPPYGETRSSLLIQVFFAGQLSNDEILAKFEGMAGTIRSVLAKYETLPELIEPVRLEVNSPREQFFWMLTLDNGMRHMKANLEWAESIIEQLKNGKVPDK